jgi:hypothetical protein
LQFKKNAALFSRSRAMRLQLFIVPLALVAAPVAAQAPAARAQAPSAEDMRLPPELSDPRLADRLVDALKILSRSFLAIPTGEVEAALEGRQVTAAERTRTVASETGLTERELQRKLDDSRPAMQGAQKALVAAIPAMMKGLVEASKELEKATANMPQPGYPKR